MRASVLAAVGVFGLALFAGGQQTPPPKPAGAAQDEPTRFSLEVTRVSMVFSVMDKKGRFVTDLTKDDFDVFENKKAQAISEFAAESDLPLRMGILIDTSNSIRDRFRIEQEAASEFLKSLMRSNIDKAMIMSFDSKAELAADLTDNTDKLESTINGLRPGGGTALYDAIYLACRDQLSRDQPSSKFRRIILVVSDGEDNQSEYTRDQALEMALKADAVIFAVSTNNLTRGDTEGDKTLKYLTVQTGGRAYFPFRPEDLAQNFEIISEEVRHQYVILFRPDPLKTDGMFHPVELRVKGHKELAIRARSGYYAPKM
ncbi:MAG TPA: VWA domain-containing protein [Bryobacteraceae bacterium]|nr:VWA domain-containing protein [Bryobacteraceae bacterium]